MSLNVAAGAASELASHLGDLSRASTSNAPSPTVASSDLTPAPEALAAHSAPQSQLTNATWSNSSDKANVNGDDAAAHAAATYGTRSRNRPGRARPNYADDKDIDLEIEASGKYPKASKKASATAAPSSSAPEMENSTSRNGFAAINGGAPIPPSVHAATMNGSYDVAPPSSSASKKRKQPGSNVTVATAQSTPPPPPSNPKPIPTTRAQFLGTNCMSFSKSRAYLNSKQQLVADDGTTIAVNDHAYFICEPPGEPYYFGRIMEFLHVENSASSPVEAVRVNWFYRPKDIQRRVQDTRVVFASMHSDTCPLASLRGKCHIEHMADIPDLDEFRKRPDAFWFDKLYDRYMLRYYEVIPTAKVVNVPRHVKKILDERWKFVLVEVGRGKDLTAASKVCKRCSDFAANHESVDCAVCKNTYHMSCVRPPLQKKPARGFAWACGPCSRAQELKMEARHTPLSENELSRLAEAESYDDEEDESQPQDQTTRENSTGAEQHPQPTEAQLAQANLWPWRYLGIHSKPEDALDIDDRIYPRASSRLGPRHQANTTVWHGRPVEFIRPAEARKKYKPSTGGKKDAKTAALLDTDTRAKRPKWVFDEPPGFVSRGQDEPIELKGKKEYTAQLTFKMPDPAKFTERGLDDDVRPNNFGEIVDKFLDRCVQEISAKFSLNPSRPSVDIRTKALEKLQENDYDVDKAMDVMRKVTAKADLKLPDLTKDEVKRFEEGVAKYGSELHLVARHVSPTIKEGRIVRFYYMWKKTDRGEEIWGDYEGRKSKKDSKKVEKDAQGARLLDDVADDGDDSAFDEEKATKVKRGFKCKFCTTTHSRMWRRAPMTAPGTLVPRDPGSKNQKDKSSWLVSALCGKCAYLWRRYAVQYESIEEISKKIAISGGRASKRKVDEELMRIVVEAQSFAGDTFNKNTAQIAASAGIEIPLSMVEPEDSLKKKPKTDFIPIPIPPEVVVDKKKVVPEKPAELEPLKPEMPRVKEHPCAVCHTMSHPGHRMLKCRDCRLHVHAPCYGVVAPAGAAPWYCDMCKNDHNTQVSTNYECVLCPVRRTPQELMEPPKVSHKKKTDREREKERAEREMVNEAGRRWREDQLAAGRPVDPREPLKRTAWNNWMHVNCAVWCKEIRFGNAELLDAAEGVGFIPEERFTTACKYCTEKGFPVVTCQFAGCNSAFHVGCAHQRRLTMGFDITPIKLSRRDSVPVMKLDQESGLAVPGIWCPNHAVPTIVHDMLESTPSGLTALQEFVRTYKQVDSSITGTVRRAAQFENSFHPVANTTQAASGRISVVNSHAHEPTQVDPVSGRTARSPSPMSPQLNGDAAQHNGISLKRDAVVKSEKKCCTCLTEHSPKWWKVDASATPKAHTPSLQQAQPPSQPSESTSARASSSVQPPSPIAHHHQIPSLGPLPTQASLSGLQIKPEPVDLETMDIPEEVLYQCHKCRVQKKTPPSSPSQVRRPRPQVIDAPSQPAVYPAVSIGQPPLVHSNAEAPPHGHPMGPGPPPYANGAPAWSNQPYRNGVPPVQPPPAMYGHPPLHHRTSDFGYPYPPVHYQGPSGLPPPGSRPNGFPQHSPPPGPYTHSGPVPPSNVQPGQPQSPLVGVSSGPPPFSHRPADSPSLAYGPPRGYPPPSQVPPRAPALPGNFGHMAQSTTEQAGLTRRPSQDSTTTPRLGISRPGGPGESSRMDHQGREETPREPDGGRERRGSTNGPGASASPSLKNLLR